MNEQEQQEFLQQLAEEMISGKVGQTPTDKSTQEEKLS
jgi:hypothetical protein